MKPEGDYIFLTAEVSLAAVGVHAHAAAIAAAAATNGVIDRSVLQRRGMTDSLERELLEAGLLQLVGGAALCVAVEVPSTAAAELSRRRAADRARSKKRDDRRREKAASSAPSREIEDPANTDRSRESRDSREDTQIPGSATSREGPEIAGSLSLASYTRGDARAPGPALSPLLNPLEGGERALSSGIDFRSLSPSNSDVDVKESSARELDEQLDRVREILASAFDGPADTVADKTIVRALAMAHHKRVDPVDAALEAAVCAANPVWKTRDAGATLAFVVRQRPAGSDHPTLPASPVPVREGWGPAATAGATPAVEPARRLARCPLAEFAFDERVALDTRWAQVVEVLRRELTDTTYELWIAPCRPHVVGDAIELAAAGATAGWVRDRFTHVLEQAATEVAGRRVLADVVVCDCAQPDQLRRTA